MADNNIDHDTIQSSCSLKAAADQAFSFIEKELSMACGTGDGSYARNSAIPALAIGKVTPVLEEALKGLQLLGDMGDDHRTVIKVADLGCSTGSNTLSAVETVVNCLRLKHPQLLHRPDLEYQAFFSDLPSNDFNTLFAMLPPHHQGSYTSSSAGDDQEAASANQLPNSRHYYAAGVPGSFYKRLFPRSSLHVVTSFSALHWISKIPETVLDPSSAAWSKGKVTINRAHLPFVAAIAEQAKEDLRAFLKCRAEEMVPGGLLFLLFVGREDHSHPEIQWPSKPVDPDSDASDPNYIYASESQKTWDALVSEGVIREETRNSFVVPTYFRSLIEVEEAVKENGCFRVEILRQTVESFFSSADREKWRRDHKAFAKMWCNLGRSTIGKLEEAHIGSHHLATTFFERNEQYILESADNILSSAHYYVNNLASLIRI